MDSVRDVFKHNKARKNVIIGGMVILICITALSCVSSFMIYRGGFADLPYIFQQALALFAVVVVEGAFVWLLYGFTRAFSSGMERLVSLAGLRTRSLGQRSLNCPGKAQSTHLATQATRGDRTRHRIKRARTQTHRAARYPHPSGGGKK